MNRRLGGAFPPSREEGRLDEWAFAREMERGEGEDTIGDANNTKIVFDFFTMPTVTK